MPHVERGMRNPAKYLEPTIEGKCPYCHKHVKSLSNHIHAKHKGERL